MKRSAFTLVELIFVIVIIGVLSAVAVPKFKSLKQNAEVKAVIKATTDAATTASSAAVNHMDLEEVNASDMNLSMLVDLKGKGWSYTDAATGGKYDFNNTKNTATIASVDFNATARIVHYKITCASFVDSVSQEKCKSDLNNSTGVDINLTF